MTRDRHKLILPAVFLFCLIFSTGAWAVSTLEGCFVLPANNIWNTPVDHLPVHSHSAAFINAIGGDTGLHADFGSGEWEGGPIGIPYTVVNESQAKVDISFDYAGESDPGPYPIPPDALIEGGSDAHGDRHVLILVKDNCLLYEIFDAHLQTDGSWHAGSGAIFDLGSNALRPDTWTSADAAGLPILPGLARYDEVAVGNITHALRFTAPQTRKAHVWPARHDASSLTDPAYPPMGQRFRLKADFDISGFPAQIQTLLNAFKKYGIILADNGSSWYISGVPDPRWDNDLLRLLRQVKGSDFEAVDVSSLTMDENSGEAKQSAQDMILYVSQYNNGCGGHSPCYSSIQTALDVAENLSSIRVAQGPYGEFLNLNRPVSITISGGWNSSFGDREGFSTLNGVQVGTGSMTLRQLKIVPASRE